MNLHWKSWSDFLEMGGYGLYVWGSFAAVALGVLIEIWSLRARRRAVITEDDE
jgi:heme exporter protein D